jgi:hypothetical protein
LTYKKKQFQLHLQPLNPTTKKQENKTPYNTSKNQKPKTKNPNKKTTMQIQPKTKNTYTTPTETPKNERNSQNNLALYTYSYLEEPHPLELYPDLLDQAAEEIYSASIERVPKNGPQTPYKALPEHEKQKERKTILTASSLLESSHPLPNRKEFDEYLAHTFAKTQHEEWKKSFDPENRGNPQIENSAYGPININTPWETLNPEWKKEKIQAGRTAVAALKKLNTAIGESIIRTLGKKFLACN